MGTPGKSLKLTEENTNNENKDDHENSKEPKEFIELTEENTNNKNKDDRKNSKAPKKSNELTEENTNNKDKDDHENSKAPKKSYELTEENTNNKDKDDQENSKAPKKSNELTEENTNNKDKDDHENSKAPNKSNELTEGNTNNKDKDDHENSKAPKKSNELTEENTNNKDKDDHENSKAPRKSNELTEVNTTNKNKYEQDIVGDGNCFYSCISLYLYGQQNYHSKIRQNIIRYMLGGGCMSEAENEERSRRYRRLMLNTRQSYEDYLRLHSNNGVWADEPIIQAAADLYGFNIYVSSYGNYGVTQRVRATSEQLRHDSGRLLHLRLQNSHYTCIEHGSVPSGDFVEMSYIIEFGKQYGAEPYEDSLDVLDYSKTVGLPKTVGDDESSNAGIDPFNKEFKDLKDKKKIGKVLKKKWNFKVDEETTWDVNYITNHIADENLPGKNGSA